MALGTTNITTTLVGQTIGVASRDVGTLCSASLINKWSFYKPVSISNKVTGINDDDLFSINDGFTIPSYQYPSLLLNARLGGIDWVYSRPTGGALSPFRLGDYRGYNHSAANWFTLYRTNGGGDLEQGYTLVYEMSNCDIQWLISNFKLFKDFVYNQSNIPISGILDLGFIIRKTSFGSSGTSCHYVKIMDWLDSVGVDRPWHIIIPNDLSVGSYYIIPVLTTDTNRTAGVLYNIKEDDLSNGTWFMLPSNANTINIVTAGTGDLSAIDFNLVSFNITNMGNFHYRVNSVILNFTNSHSSDITIQTDWKMTDNINQTWHYPDSVTVPANGAINVQLINSNDYPNGFEYESVIGEPTLRMEITKNGASNTKTFDLY